MNLIKLILCLLFTAFLAGCVSDPLMTGKPQDWMGHQASDLRAAMGEPTRVISSSNGDEVWEYATSKDYVIPKGENMSLGFGGLGGPAGGAGAFSMEKRPEDRQAQETQLLRFKVRKGVIVEWYANRSVNGRIVWQDH